MKKKIVFVICLFSAVSVMVFAQTAVELENLLETKKLSYGQAARFVLKAADVSELLDTAEAFRFAAERQWLPRKAGNNDMASLEGVSLLVMRSFDLKGGLMYSLFKNPHYAYREMVYRELIQGRADPEMPVSGEALLFMVGRVLSLRGDDVAPELPDQAAQKKAEQQTLADEVNNLLAANSIPDASVRITDEGVTISLANLQFVANSVDLPETEKTKLRGVAKIFESIKERNLLVSGHTALAGTPEERQQTSYDRARAVADFLVSLGVRKADEVQVKGFGAEQPIADNNTPEGMALNRRVEITILENQ